ncbi:hypothetical protein [Nocardia sp. NPDC005366]|uniref:MmyB family transcriptional regulator n=1 Tax=Nocardia sp. NPDC005366 TaxID=3156878 RepID=UPI0033B7F025
MREDPTLPGMPNLIDSLEFLRHRRHLSRESTAKEAGFSGGRLNQINQKRTAPGPAVFKKLLTAFDTDLDTDQRRHLRELKKPSLYLPTTGELRQRLTRQGVDAHLNYLDTRNMLALCIDPLRFVLHANQTFHRMVPGLAEVDNNYVRWLFTPAARDRITDWDTEVIHTITILRANLGRYRALPRARDLYRQLRATPGFTPIWDATTMQVAYGCPHNQLLHIHTPDTDETSTLRLEISDYGGCPETLLIHGFPDACAIAC